MARSQRELAIEAVRVTDEKDSLHTEQSFLSMLGKAHRKYALKQMKAEKEAEKQACQQ